MSRYRQFLFGWVLLALVCVRPLGTPALIAAPQWAEPARSEAPTSPASAAAAAAHQDASRLELLRDVGAASSDSPLARWYRGQVRLDGRWVPIEDVPGLLQNDARHQRYLEVRREYEDTLQGHLALADWCKRERIPEQARAHFRRVLDWDPDHPQARAALGYRRIGGFWLTQEDVEAVRRQSQQFTRNLRQWKPELTPLVRRVHSGREAQRREALDRLTAIDDPAAIPALEQLLGEHNQPDALLLVETLGKLPGPEGTMALARQAVFSPWPAVRLAAAKQLKPRPWETFIPEMLSTMCMPADTNLQFWALCEDGRPRHRLTAVRESYQGTDQLVYETINRLLVEKRLGEIGEQNARLERVNDRIIGTLAQVTGDYGPETPQEWWDWWDRYQERQAVEETYPEQNRYRRITLSCFVVGTPVWTADGPRAIQTLQVGDMVLAQDAETGELAYKPVLRTTVRQPTDLVGLRLAPETLGCTRGHAFWQVGKGWLRARDLGSGCRLHGVYQSVEVAGINPAPSERTFNLVVADFHTYFVGNCGVLVHDNSPFYPTAAPLPGIKTQTGIDANPEPGTR